MNDLVLCKFGQNYDFEEIDTECDYVVDVLEPFLDLSIDKGNKLAKKKLDFSDKDGKHYSEKVSDILNGGLKIYYHDKPLRFDPMKFPGVRKEGLLNALLDEVDVFVFENKLN